MPTNDVYGAYGFVPDSKGRGSLPMFDFLPSPEGFADLVFAVGLLWQSVELLTERVAKLEAGQSGVCLCDTDG